MVECFAFLLLFNDFALSRLPPQVQGPSAAETCQSEDSLGEGILQPSSAAPSSSRSAPLTATLLAFHPVPKGLGLTLSPVFSSASPPVHSSHCPLLKLLSSAVRAPLGTRSPRHSLPSALAALPHPLSLQVLSSTAARYQPPSPCRWCRYLNLEMSVFCALRSVKSVLKIQGCKIRVYMDSKFLIQNEKSFIKWKF